MRFFISLSKLKTAFQKALNGLCVKATRYVYIFERRSFQMIFTDWKNVRVKEDGMLAFNFGTKMREFRPPSNYCTIKYFFVNKFIHFVPLSTVFFQERATCSKIIRFSIFLHWVINIMNFRDFMCLKKFDWQIFDFTKIGIA